MRLPFPPDLFQPGAGSPPPHLAGRRTEIQALAPFEAAIRGKRRLRADVILHGPRGNGKTVLLDVIGDRLEAAGAQVVRTTAKGKATSCDALGQALAPEDGWGAAVRRLAEKVGAGAPNRLSLFGVSLDWGKAAGPSVEQMLASRCAEAPLAVLVDEAQTLPSEVGQQLLDASQSLRRAGAPFLLVLAGTPGLQHALRGMQVSFWERSRRVPVGRLNAGEDRDALMKPLRELGAAVADRALARLLEAANRYPYFIQEVGDAVVAALNERGAKQIDAAVAERALASFTPVKHDFYDGRRMELLEAGLLPLAEAAAAAFQGDERLPPNVLENVLQPLCAGRDGPGLAQALQGLVDKGVVWSRDGRYEPGIPSLLRHLAQFSARQSV